MIVFLLAFRANYIVSIASETCLKQPKMRNS